MAGMMVGR
jgi:hypothetical protein